MMYYLQLFRKLQSFIDAEKIFLLAIQKESDSGIKFQLQKYREHAVWQSACMNSCHWELVPLSALSVLFPFLSNPSNLFSVFQFLGLHNSKSNLPVYGLGCVKCSAPPSGKTQCIFRILFISSSSSASNTGLLYKGISARWLIRFFCRCFHFPSSVALKAGPQSSLQANLTTLEE